MTTNPNLTTITHDGVLIEITDAGARVIEQLKSELQAAIADKDKALGARDAEIAKLKDGRLSPDDIDRLAAERADVLARAEMIADGLECAGKTNGDIRRAAVAARLGADTIDAKSDDYVEALFDSLTTSADPLRDAIKNHQAPAGAGEAYRAYTNRLANAWKHKGTN